MEELDLAKMPTPSPWLPGLLLVVAVHLPRVRVDLLALGRLPLLVQEVETPTFWRRGRVGASSLTGHHGHHIGVGIVANLVEALK